MAMACGFQTSCFLVEGGKLFTSGNRSGVPKCSETSIYSMVSAFGHNTGAVDIHGVVWTWGKGYFGALGHPDRVDKEIPTSIDKTSFAGLKALMLACGKYHTIVLTEDGHMWTFGDGSKGILGHGDRYRRYTPTLVLGERIEGKITMVAAGGVHSMAVGADGHVYTWGDGWDGVLGRGGDDDKLDALVPTAIDKVQFGGSQVLYISCGQSHAVAVTIEGRVYVWGCGKYGQLGLGDRVNMYYPTMIGNSCFGGEYVRKSACAENTTFVVTVDGVLWSFGYGGNGTLGHNCYEDRVTPQRVDARHFSGSRIVLISTGTYVSMAVTNEGNLYTWGQSRVQPRPTHLKYLGGLYTGLCQSYRVETLIPKIVSGRFCTHNSRVGVYHRLPTEFALAFAMGTDIRLSNGAVICLNGFTNLVEMVVDLCTTTPANHLQEMHGFMQVMGFHSV